MSWDNRALAARKFCRVIDRLTTQPLFENCEQPERFRSVKLTWTSLPWVRRPKTRASNRPGIHGTDRAFRAVRAAAPPLRWPRTKLSALWARTPADRFANRPLCARSLG